MTHFYVLLLALGIGVVAGLRSMTAPAVVAWAAMLRWINLNGTWASWMGSPVTVAVFTILAVGELIADKLPMTPNRTSPPSFIARIVSGGFSGAVIGTAWGYTWSALGAGAVGAVLGTLGGFHVRTRVFVLPGNALPIALLEDAIAVLGGLAIAATTAVL